MERQSTFFSENAGKKLFAFFLITFFFLNVSWKWVLAQSYVPDLGGFERNVIWGIQRIMSGRALYTNPENLPFSFVQYMPLYYELLAFLGKLFSIQPGDAHGVYRLARILNLMISLGFSGIVFFTSFRRFKVPLFLAGTFAILSFLVSDTFTISGRPDSLKAFFLILQVFVLSKSNGLKLRYKMVTAFLLSLCCFLCKQDGIVAFGILPLAFLFGAEWKNLGIYVVGAGLVLASGLIFLQWNYGDYFFANTVGGLKNGISLSWFMSVFRGYFGLYVILFAPALMLAFEFAYEKNRELRVLAAAMFVVFFPSLLASLKFGSGVNYFQESLLISCILVPIGISAFSGLAFFHFSSSKWFFPSLAFLLFFGLSGLNWFAGVFLNQEAALKSTYEKDLAFATKLKTEFPHGEMILLTDRQWEDNLTTILFDCIVNPNRDVSAQVFEGKKGDALKGLSRYVSTHSNLILLTRFGQKPSFPGQDFSAFHVSREFGGYQVWTK